MTRAALLLALLVLACSPRPPEPIPAGERPVLFFAGEELGYLEPCGCTRPQLGGLARKGTAVAGGALLELGNLVDRPGRLSELKYETFLLAFSGLGVRALAVGERDLALGLEFLLSARDLASFPVICANLLDGAGRPAFSAFADFEAGAASYRAIAVLDPALAPGARTSDPDEAVGGALAGLPEGRRAVLLAVGAEPFAARLLARHPALAAVAYAKSGGEPIVRSERLFSPGDRSRWLIRLADAPAVVEMSEDIRDDPAMVDAMRTYVRRVAEEDLLHRLNPRAPPAGGGYAGDEDCAACHGEAARIHGGSRHARAIESLARTGREVDPDCVVCHVVGYGEDTGFTARGETPALARVGCENCHGPAADHARGTGPAPARDARASCLSCHNGDTDPYFRFDAKWEKIRH